MIEQSSQEHHLMELIDSDTEGADEFYCPTCGRRVLYQWPPDYKKIVLDPGDEYAIHSGGKGGLEISAPQLAQIADTSAQDVADQSNIHDSTESFSVHDQDRLFQWDQWLDQMGFENLWS